MISIDLATINDILHMSIDELHIKYPTIEMTISNNLCTVCDDTGWVGFDNCPKCNGGWR